MPKPDKTGRDALERLDEGLSAFDASRKAAPGPAGVGGAAGQGYRVLAQMLGGIMGGLGFGWLVDHFAHTRPWGVLIGLVIGTGLSIYGTIQTASRVTAPSAKDVGPGAADDDGDD